MRGAHRVAYCEANGLLLSDITGLVVRHKCDNPPCVNPDHLELGTVADNNRDKIDRGRFTPMRGEKNGNSRLTPEAVNALRSEYRPHSKDANVYTLAKKFGISKSMAHYIVTQKNWVQTEGVSK